MALYREQGIVLRTYKLGETDRILSLLTPGRGKVRAVAKGVRRPGSRFGGRLEPYSHVDLQLYEGRNLDVVAQAELITSFTAVREDFALSACAATIVEAADRVAQEQERATRLVLLVLDALRALARDPQYPSVVLDAYLLRLASLAGYHPDLGACAGCGAPGDHRV
ncbi:MAG: DNA repair protein RecO, partial [Actinomycetota bacterium]|nr:DNA repair protein RecO [Actinomycetota bacterium]